MMVRTYQPDDRERVRFLCCATGFLGNPVDPLFSDRETFADFLTAYYTDAEPESAFVMEHEGEVLGYLLGCCYPARNRAYLMKVAPRLALRLLWRYAGYPHATREYVRWLFRRSWRETPPAPKEAAHFHINLLPTAKSVAGTREMMDRFLLLASGRGCKSVFGQMVTRGERRASRMFERYGFRQINKREVTKFREHHDEPVFLCTVVKDLTENTRLYGVDLHKQPDPEK